MFATGYNYIDAAYVYYIGGAGVIEDGSESVETNKRIGVLNP